MTRYVLDTSVLVEIIVKNSPLKGRVKNLLQRSQSRGWELYVTTTTLTEVYYVSTKLYRAAGTYKPEEHAKVFVEWLAAHANVVNIDYDIAVEAGRLKDKLGLSLADTFVIAAALVLNAVALFKKPEKEMNLQSDAFPREHVGFLIDY